MPKQRKLSEAVADRYDLVGVKPGKHNFAKFGQLDLCALTLDDAKTLVKAGFPHLKAKVKVKAEKPKVKKD